MAEDTRDKEFVEYVVRAIVDNPDDVVVDRTIDERGVLLTLKVNPQDMGYVIGRQGATARSIRTLLRVVGAQANARVNLKIEEPEGSSRPSRRPRRDVEERQGREEAQDGDTSIVDDLKI